MSRNPVGMAKPPSEYDEELVVASNKAFINNIDLIDNVILNNLANQKKAPCELIKKRAKNKGLLNEISNAELLSQFSKNSASGQLKPHKQIQFHLKSARNQSAH